MKILSIIPYKILPAHLGGEKGIALFNEYISKKLELTGVTTADTDPSLAKGYQMLNLLSTSRLRYLNIFLYFTIRKLLRKTESKHLLIEHPYFGWLAWLIKMTSSTKIIVHSHNIEYMRSRSIGRKWWKFLKWYEGWVYGFADLVFFISDDDRQFAIRELSTSPTRSMTITYGIETGSLPTDLEEKKKAICARYQIAPDSLLLLFNGALYHHTNYDALRVILEQINPRLLQSGLRYKILICGKGLPDSFNELRDYADKNVIYAGFVDDITTYFKAADIFLNPILSGGGVKTKAIEALSMNCTVISTELGAMGIPTQVCGEKLIVINRHNWKEFAETIVTESHQRKSTPPSFFEYYYWGNITQRAAEAIAAL